MTAATTDSAADMARLVHEHQAGVWRYLRFLGCDAAVADDLTQETFLEVLRRPPEFRSPSETSAYLRRVARNRLLMTRRKDGRQPAQCDLELAEQAWAEAVRDGPWEDYLDRLRTCLQSAVSKRTRQALGMHYGDGAGREEIARQMRMKSDGVKTMLRRARQALRECIERKRPV